MFFIRKSTRITTMFEQPLPASAPDADRIQRYEDVVARIKALVSADPSMDPNSIPQPDWVTAMSTVVCELHHAFDYFHWTGILNTIEHH